MPSFIKISMRKRLRLSDLARPDEFILSLVNNALKHHAEQDTREDWKETAMVDDHLSRTATAQFYPLHKLQMSKLRSAFGISAEMYREALSSVPFCGGEVGDGKSKALFFYNLSSGVIAKTLNDRELALLGRILPSMIDHLTANAKTSILPRYLGCFRIKCSVGISRTLVVMANVFPVSTRVGKKFDLKGSSLGRLVSPEQLADGCTTLKDANFSLKGLDQSHRTIKAAANSLVDTHQLIYHSLTSRNNFIEALGRDVQWLMQQRLIDYSLLVGFADEKKDVHNGSGEAKNTEGLFKKTAKVVTIASHIAKISKINIHRKDNSTALIMTVASSSEVEGDSKPLCAPSEYSTPRGHCSSDAERTTAVFVGLIDILTKFGAVKSAEYRFKQTLEIFHTCQIKQSHAMSCVPPEIYGKRMMSFVSANTVVSGEIR